MLGQVWLEDAHSLHNCHNPYSFRYAASLLYWRTLLSYFYSSSQALTVFPHPLQQSSLSVQRAGKLSISIFFLSILSNKNILHEFFWEWACGEKYKRASGLNTDREKKKNTLCHCFTTNTEKKSLQIWNVLSFPKGSFHFLYMSYIYVNLHKEWIFIETSKLYNHG